MEITHATSGCMHGMMSKRKCISAAFHYHQHPPPPSASWPFTGLAFHSLLLQSCSLVSCPHICPRYCCWNSPLPKTLHAWPPRPLLCPHNNNPLCPSSRRYKLPLHSKWLLPSANTSALRSTPLPTPSIRERVKNITKRYILLEVLGPLRASTSSWSPFRPPDFLLRVLWYASILCPS